MPAHQAFWRPFRPARECPGDGAIPVRYSP